MESGKGIRIETCEGVYEPAEDSYLMAGTVECGKRVLEIGSGTGLVSVSCALKGSEVEAVDINPAAVECTRSNASLNGCSVNAHRSDLFSDIPPGKKYGTIIFNPPYLPTEDNIQGSEQWDGGPDGFSVTRRFLVEAPSRLEEHGEIYIILSSLTDMDALMNEFSSLRFEVVSSQSFFFEKIFVWRITS